MLKLLSIETLLAFILSNKPLLFILSAKLTSIDFFGAFVIVLLISVSYTHLTLPTNREV